MEPENKNNSSEIKPEKKKWKFSLRNFLNGIRNFLNGNILLEGFITKQGKLLALIFCLILLFITNRYYCSKQLTEMDNLKKELSDLNSEKVFLNTRLTAIRQQSQIEALLRENGIELKKDNATVYQISK